MLFYSLETLLDDPQDFAFRTGATFRGLTISETHAGWNIILRAFLRDGEAVYCLTTAEEPGEGLRRLVGVLGTNGGENLWRRDNYYKNSA